MKSPGERNEKPQTTSGGFFETPHGIPEKKPRNLLWPNPNLEVEQLQIYFFPFLYLNIFFKFLKNLYNNHIYSYLPYKKKRWSSVLAKRGTYIHPQTIIFHNFIFLFYKAEKIYKNIIILINHLIINYYLDE